MTRLFQSEPFGPLHIELAAEPEPQGGGATSTPEAPELAVDPEPRDGGATPTPEAPEGEDHPT